MTKQATNLSVLDNEQNVKASLQKKTIKTFNSRYVSPVLNSIPEQTLKQYAICVKSDMGSGKSHSSAEKVHAQPPRKISLAITHSTQLCSAFSSSMQQKLNEFAAKDGTKQKRVLNYQDADLNIYANYINRDSIMNAHAIVTTYNSFPKIWKAIKELGLEVAFVFFDESESGAQFLAQGTITNKAEAGKAIQEATAVADAVFLFDAHLSRATTLFAETFISKPVLYYTNQKTIWDGFTYSINEEAAGLLLIKDALEKGEPAFITSTTATLARRIYKTIIKEGWVNKENAFCGFPESEKAPLSDEVDEVKKNLDLFANYKVAIISPTMGTGLDITIKHFHHVISFMIRDKDAPDASGALQMPFRVRNPINKHIDIVFIDQADRGKPRNSREIDSSLEALLKLKEESYKTEGGKKAFDNFVNHPSHKHFFYESEIEKQKSENFDIYFNIILSELDKKGMKRVEPKEINKPALDIRELKKEANKEIKEDQENNLINAAVISDNDAKEISLKKKSHKEKITIAEHYKYEKYKLMNDYHFNDEMPIPDDIRSYIKMNKQGVASGGNNIALSFMPLTDVNTIISAYKRGIGEDELFKKDSASSDDINLKVKWEFSRLLKDIAGIEVKDGKYTIEQKIIDKAFLRDINNEKTEKRVSFIAAIMKFAAKWNAIKPEVKINKTKLKKEPVQTIRHLLETQLKLKTDKKGLRGQDAFRICEDQQVLDVLNSRIEKHGFVSYLAQLEKIKEKIAEAQPEPVQPEQPQEYDTVEADYSDYEYVEPSAIYMQQPDESDDDYLVRIHEEMED